MKKIILSTGLAALLMPVASTLAQTTNETTATIEEVLVTGRKREESLTEVPVSISVFDITALEDQGIDSQDDLFAATPGLDYSNFNGTRDGNNPGVRGVQSDLRASNQQRVTSFLDGMPMQGNQGTLQFFGIDAVEVYRGPQSAAFGRATFAGAINYVTSDSEDEFTGRVLVNASDLGAQEVGLMVSGPINDNLGYRIAYMNDSWEGPDEWTANDGTELGSNETELLSAKFNFEFSDTAYGELAFSHQETFDQAGASWVADITNCQTGSGVFRTNMGATVELPSDNWDCDTEIPAGGITRNGDVYGQFINQYDVDLYTSRLLTNETPAMGPGAGVAPDFAAADIDMNGAVELSEYLAQTFADGQTYEQALLGQTLGANGGTDGERTRIQGELNFEIGDSLLQFFAMNSQDKTVSWNESDNNGTVAVFTVNGMTGQTSLGANVMSMLVPTDIEESYAEVRWVSPDEERLRYTLAASYYDYSLQAQVYNNGGAFLYDLIVESGDNAGLSVDPGAGITTSEIATNVGASVGVQYDLTDRTTLSFEGRYQVDDVCGADNTDGLNFELCQETKAFLPRIAINSNLTDTTSVYGQISIGNNPAGVNIAYQNPGNIQALLIASGQIAVPDLAANGQTIPVNQGVIYNGLDGNPDPTVSYDATTFPAFDEEKLTNYELGIKGSFAEGQGAFTAAVYFMDYKNIVGAENLNWNDTNELDGTELGGWNEGSWSTFTNERTWVNQGDGEMYGIELTADYAINDIWTVGGYVTLSSAKYTDYCSIQAPDYSTFIDDPDSVDPADTIEVDYIEILTPETADVLSDCGVVNGNWIPQQTPFTANFNLDASLPNDIFGMRTSLRADIRHKGYYYEDQLNLARRDAVTTMNVSANLRSDDWTVRLFVDNLFDNDQPTRISQASGYVTGDDPTLAATVLPSWAIVPTRPREIGLQVQYSF